MDPKITSKILEKVTKIPGLVGLVNIDHTKKPVPLKKDKYHNSLKFEETSEGVIVNLAFIIYINVNAKAISNNLTSIVENIFNENNLSLKKVNLYIRGIQ